MPFLSENKPEFFSTITTYLTISQLDLGLHKTVQTLKRLTCLIMLVESIYSEHFLVLKTSTT